MRFDAKNILVELRKGGFHASKAASLARNNGSISEQVELLNCISDDQRHLNKLLTGTLFANTWADVWATVRPANIENSQRAINWHTAVFTQQASVLQAHINLRSDFTQSVLMGNWQVAREVLRIHQEQLGMTLWGLAWLVVLAEESGGVHSRMELVDLFQREGNLGNTVPVLARIFSLSADKNIPEESYRTELRKFLPNNNRAFRQFLEILLLEDFTESWEAHEILACSELLPLIDRYELFLRLTAIALASRHKDANKLARATARIAKQSNDYYSEYIAECSDETTLITNSAFVKDTICAWDAYMVSDYQKSLKISTALSKQRLDLIPTHELVVKSEMYLGGNDNPSGTTPTDLVRHHLRNIFCKNEHSEDSLSYLLRFGSRFRIISITGPLRALHAQHSTPNPDGKWYFRSAYTASSHGPRNFEYGYDQKTNQKYLTQLLTLFPGSISLKFFYGISARTLNLEPIELSQIPVVRRHFFVGLSAARFGHLVEAHSNLSAFLTQQKKDGKNPLSPFAIEEARKALIDVYRLKGEFVEMQKVIAESFLERPQSVRRLPIRRAFEASLENRDECSNHIEFVILTYLSCDEPHKVCIGLKRFLRACKVDLPSQLIQLPNFNLQNLSILFLRVCTPEVIDSLLPLNSVEKVEAERLFLLDWLIKNSPDFVISAKTEVLRLTQHAQLREALQKIEGARVILNIPALREAEQEHFSDAYFRYTAQRDLAVQSEDALVSSLLEAIKMPGEKPVLIRTDSMLDKKGSAFKAFIAAFREVRDAFISSPHYGIDACLSGRIRHGILIQHIRKPFIERKLAVRKETPEYKEIQSYWRNRLFPFNHNGDYLDQIMCILIVMTDKIDAVAEEVKGVWIQLKTETRNQGGLFDFAFNEEYLRTILATRMQDVSTLEMFLDRVFEVLLERTRVSLQSVRDAIADTLCQRLTEIIDEALVGLTSITKDSTSFPSLRHDLVECRQETEPTCYQMMRWFQETDASLMGDAGLELIANTAIGMVERLNPDFRGCHISIVKSIYKIQGRHFTALVHILFFLLDNAIRHAKVSKEQFKSKVAINAEEGGLSLSVENSMQSAETAASAARIIHETIANLEASLDPAKIVKEGGSGFAKIIAAVRFGFKKKNPLIKVSHYDKSVKVTVAFDIAGLAI